MENEIRVIAIKTSEDGDWKLEVLGIPFGGPFEGKDRVGDYFDPSSKVHEDKFPVIPAVFAHGLNPETGQPVGTPEYIGKATHSKVDERGHWYEVVLNKASEFAKKIWEAALRGMAGASSGAISHLVRRAKDGHLDEWPAVEMTLIDGTGNLSPMNPYAVAIPVTKAMYEAAGLKLEEPEAGEAAPNETSTPVKGNTTMTEEEKKAAEAAAAVKAAEELKAGKSIMQKFLESQAAEAEAQQKKNEAEAAQMAALKSVWDQFKANQPPIGVGSPAILKIQRGDDAHKAFNWYLKTGDASGIRTGEAYQEAVKYGDIKTTYTLLEGTQYVGQEAVPTEVAARIIEKRDAVSILRRGGAQVLQAASNALIVPIEKNSPDVFVLTTEGSAFDVTTSQPVDKLTATIYMYTKTVGVSLQLLEDAAFDIEAWWARRLGRAWGLTENDFGLVGGGSGAPQGLTVGGTTAAVTAAGTNVLTAAEIVSLYGKLPFEYRDNVSWIFAQATEAAVRGLTATNTYPFVGTGGTQGGVGNIGIAQGAGWLVALDSKVYNSGSMPAMTTGLVSVLCGNIEAGYAIAERKGLTVFRDPYTLSSTGKVNIHAYFREGGGVVNSTAIQCITQHT